mmetsp:Transcript_39189/g.71346  ORF Transcript_39189/g.71346 Transcript_39189/m.71346 type:complete len:644 (+) Transcript_39189:54-1985(+)
MPGQSDPDAEKELQKLRKLDSNKKCPNCGKDGGLAGHNAVCVPYKTFICTDCKSAHQSFSHRCKSCTESFWTKEDVKALKEKYGGGNAAALRTWLAKVPDSDWLKEGDDLNKKKRFIEKAYEEKKYWADGGAAAGSGEESGKKEKKHKKEKKAEAGEEAPESPGVQGKKEKKDKKEKKAAKGEAQYEAEAYNYEADPQYYGYYGGAYQDGSQQYYAEQYYYPGAEQYSAEAAESWQQQQAYQDGVEGKVKKEKKAKKEKKGEVAEEAWQPPAEAVPEVPAKKEKKEKKDKKSKKGEADGMEGYDGYGYDATAGAIRTDASWGQEYAGQAYYGEGYGFPAQTWNGADAAGYYAEGNGSWAPEGQPPSSPEAAMQAQSWEGGPMAGGAPQDPNAMGGAWNGGYGQATYSPTGAYGGAYPGGDVGETAPYQEAACVAPASPAAAAACNGCASPSGQGVAPPVLAAAAAALGVAKKEPEAVKPPTSPILALLQAQLATQQPRSSPLLSHSNNNGFDAAALAGFASLGKAPNSAQYPATTASSPSLPPALLSLAMNRQSGFTSSPGAPSAVPGPYSPLTRSPILGARPLGPPPTTAERRQHSPKKSAIAQPRGWALSVPVLPTNPWAAEVAVDSKTKLQPTNPWATAN